MTMPSRIRRQSIKYGLQFRQPSKLLENNSGWSFHAIISKNIASI